MTRAENEQFVRDGFAQARPRFRALAGQFVEDVDALLDAATANFERLLPQIGYVDQPKHPMASAVFECSGQLALYLALRERGVDAHAFGRAMLAQMANAPLPAPEPASDSGPIQQRFAGFLASAEASQTGAAPNEFVYEAFLGDGKQLGWGMNIQSCAICHQFAKHDAMDLVPYMCATDDVVSDQRGQGLQRTGTIALGAHHCDFRYKNGGEPKRLVEQYPERIQIGRE